MAIWILTALHDLLRRVGVASSTASDGRSARERSDVHCGADQHGKGRVRQGRAIVCSSDRSDRRTASVSGSTGESVRTSYYVLKRVFFASPRSLPTHLHTHQLTLRHDSAWFLRYVDPGKTVSVVLNTARFGNACPFCSVSVNGSARVTPGITWGVSIGDGASDIISALNVTVVA